jgi:hypothetical protein
MNLILMLPGIFDNNVQFFNQHPIYMYKNKSFFPISFVDEDYKLTIVAKTFNLLNISKPKTKCQQVLRQCILTYRYL